MNLFVADPHWGWWIILYFFVGGIAAGAYFMATLIELLGNGADRSLSRVGYLIAFPLICLCGLFLTVDLDRPERFWHMLLKSEVVKEAVAEGWPWSGRGWSLMVHAPLLKYWSPMSVGSWALTVFGICSLLSFLGALWPEGRIARLLRRPWIRESVPVVGCLVGFFVAAYMGSLLSATNQPIWSDSTWIAPLFLTSSASTGIATMILLALHRHSAPPETLERLESAAVWALGLELIFFSIFLAALGDLLIPLLRSWHGKVMVGGTLVLGLLIPLGIHLRIGIIGGRSELAAASFALLGGFLLRYGLLTTPAEILARGPNLVAGFSPEEGRVPGGGPGADPGNKPTDLHPRSKVFNGDEP